MSMIDTKTSLQSAIQAHKSGDLKFAKALYLKVLSLDENNVQALCNLGSIYKQSGSFSLALSTLNKALCIDKNSVVSYMNLASLYLDIESFDKAVQTYNKALKLSPEDANIYNHLAIVYERKGANDKAIHFYKEAIKCDVKFVKPYNNIGVILYKQERFKSACEMFKMALTVDENHISTYVNLGASYNKAKMYIEAEKILLEALKKDENNSGACANLGNVYNKLKEHDKAFFYHNRAISLDSKSASNYANIGITYKNLLQLEEAKDALEKAVEINPNFVNAHFDLATTYLLMGEYEKGFSEYEWRFKKDEMKSLFFDLSDILQKPRFELDMQTDNKTLLLYSEQGFGDIIQFVRFAEVLKQKYPTLRLKIQVRPELKTLLKEMDCFEEILVRGEEVGDIDYQLALMSLPYLLKTTLKTLPKITPYMNIDGKIDVDIDEKKLNIGVVWGASRTSESYEGRVYSLNYLKPLMEDKDIQLYSLQVAGDVEEIKQLGLDSSEIIDLEDKLIDFKQTALMIEKLDFVITSDTSVAHLAGALGKEAWVMLQKNAEWRWGLDDDNTDWYPNHKLIHQDRQGDWDSAFKKVYELIQERKK